MADDAFAELEEAARRLTATDKATKSLNGSLGRLLGSQDPRVVFFANLACRLERVPDWDVDTGSVNGRLLKFNPDFVNGLTPAKLDGFHCHEVMHLASLHPFRMGARDPKLANRAMDLAINDILLDAGLQLPEGGCVPGKGEYAHLKKGLSFEEYYALLAGGSQEPQQDGEGEGDAEGSLDPGGDGGVEAPDSPAESRESEAECRAAVIMAGEAAKGKGELGAGIAGLVGSASKPPVDWREALRAFISQKSRDGRSWNRISRRHLSLGLYIPGRFGRKLGKVVVMVDTSGSTQPYMAAFAAALEDILTEFECEATVVYHDVPVQKISSWDPSEGPFEFENIGGGGTSHIPVFDWLNQQDGDEPACVIAFTDMESSFPAGPPATPVLWAVAGNPRAKPPFGQVVHVTLGD